MELMTEPSIDQTPEGWTKAPESYDTSFAWFTALFAQDALRLTHVRSGQRVLDVGTGTGALALAAAEAGAEVLAVDFSQGMIDYLQAKIKQRGIRHIRAATMDGQFLDVEDNSFDFAFSVFAVCFFPDRLAGFRELYRAIRPGGLAAAVNWCALERSSLFKVIAGALRKVLPNLPPPKTPPPALSLADPDLFKSEMQAGGFARINLFTVRHVWTFSDPQVVYDSLVGVQPAFARILETLDKATREAFRSAIIQSIRQEQGDGPYGLEGEAHIAIGVK
jgi:SAM-dependent methyltransferase